MAEESEKTENQETTEATQTETTAATETKEEPQTVPKERLDEVNAELKAQKETNAALQTNVALLRANTQQPAAKTAEVFNIYKHVGLNPDDPDDIANQKQQKEIDAYHQGIYNTQLSHIRFLVDHPDYPQLVGTDEQIRIGQFQEPFTEALKDPALLTMFQTSPNPQITAYVITKLHQKNKAEGTQTTTQEAKDTIAEAVKNANRVKSVSNTKGGEALSDEGRYEEMTDEEFIKLATPHGAVV